MLGEGLTISLISLDAWFCMCMVKFQLIDSHLYTLQATDSRDFSLSCCVDKVNTYLCGYSVIMSDVELIMWVCFTVMFNPLKTEIYLISI